LDTDLIEVKNYEGSGYQPVISYETWRVAVLRYLSKLEPDQIVDMERHNATDEVFILVKGHGILFIAGNQIKPSDIQSIPMKIGEIYNVKKNTWHTISLSKDAHVIIVENDNTNTMNSEVALLDEQTRAHITLSTQMNEHL